MKSNLKGPCGVVYESNTVLFEPNMVELPPRLDSSLTEVEPPGITLSYAPKSFEVLFTMAT